MSNEEQHKYIVEPNDGSGDGPNLKTLRLNADRISNLEEVIAVLKSLNISYFGSDGERVLDAAGIRHLCDEVDHD